MSPRLQLAAAITCSVTALHCTAQTPGTVATAVRTVTPKSASAAATYVIPGRTEPFESARVFTRATGIIQERRVDIGDRVKQGDVLAVVDAPELDRAVEAARAAVEQAKVRAVNARSLAERASTLLASQALSQEEADHRLADAAAAQAAMQVAQAELARLEEQQRFMTVRAPFDAIVTARNIDRGDRVRGDASTAEGWLFQLANVNTLRFAVSATPDLALRLKESMTANVQFSEIPGQVWPAKVARTSGVFDPGSGTMRVELLLENRDRSIPAGLTGTASFELPPSEGTFLVPANTLLLRAGKPALATVRDGKVALLDVAAGRNLGTEIEVTSAGLTPETAVIVNPNALLRPGTPVTSLPETARPRT